MKNKIAIIVVIAAMFLLLIASIILIGVGIELECTGLIVSSSLLAFIFAILCCLSFVFIDDLLK